MSLQFHLIHSVCYMNNSFQYCLLPHNSHSRVPGLQYRTAAQQSKQQHNSASTTVQHSSVTIRNLYHSNHFASLVASLKPSAEHLPHQLPPTPHSTCIGRTPATHHYMVVITAIGSIRRFSPAAPMHDTGGSATLQPSRNESPSIGSVFELAVCRPITITR